ncbi:MAG: hypothetical protein L3K09_02245 [Thermoplasmata archaeon]|nr:hypothetical protein [Thermoplasmata archaeon]
MLASTLASLTGAQAGSSTNYTLQGYVEQPGAVSPPPVPSGVTVDLVSSATHQVYSAQTLAGTSGQFKFNASNTQSALEPGWWGVYVPPQAHVTIPGCSPCAVLPLNSTPQYSYLNNSDLTTANYPVTITGVALFPYNATIWGNATSGGLNTPVSGATVELTAPSWNGFVLSSNTTNKTGGFTLSAPWSPAGSPWVVETIVPGTPNHYNFTQLTVAASKVSVSPNVKNFLTWGYVNLLSNPSAHVPNGGNATLIDPSTGYVYSMPTPAGGFYAVGTYPSNFAGPGVQKFDLVLSTIGYGTTWYPLNVSAANPSSGANPHNVLVSPVSAPSSYLSTLNFSQGFGKLNVTTVASLTSNSVLPELANASVGDLWAQLALDWQHNLTFNAANAPGVESWVNSSGPFFPAGQAMTTVNGTGFGQPTNDTFTPSSTCVSWCGLNSSATMGFVWHQSYNVTAKIAGSSKSYTLAFNFKHPTNSEAMNYTVVLPAGYVLNAGTSAPAQSKLVTAGPGGTWTSFTLVSQPSSSAGGSASFTVVKYGNITASVNVSVSNFAFSKLNVLNHTRANYTVILGAKENATFSAVNSTFASGTNGTKYIWNFGDLSPVLTTSKPTTNHTYNATSAAIKGSLAITSSGGKSSSANFTVYVSSGAPTAVITTNASAAQTHVTTGGVTYLMVNSSATLKLNASKSSSTLYSGAPVKGVISVAYWNISSFGYNKSANYSAGGGANPLNNLTQPFQGAGHYLSSGMVNGTPVPISAFKRMGGWQYNITLKVWDGAGVSSTAKLVVLVLDTEKPVPVANIYDASGKSISASGVVEGSNHSVEVQLSAKNTTDPHNGSVTWYNWSVTNKGNTSAHWTWNLSSAAPTYPVPANVIRWLPPQGKPYTVNLTVTDRAGNTAYTTIALTVSANASARPVLSVSNLTAPSTVTVGSSYTVWANFTTTVGQNSTCDNLTVRFYLLPPSGSGTPIYIGGSPGSVQFYGYVNGTVNSSATSAPGGVLAKLPYNQTVRAQLSGWSPARVGTWDIWVNGTCTNEFAADLSGGANQAHNGLVINQNPIVLTEEILGVIGIVAGVIAVLLFWNFRLRGKGGKPVGTKGGSSKSTSKKDDDEDEDEA